VDDHVEFYDSLRLEPIIIEFAIVAEFETFQLVLRQQARNTPSEHYMEDGRFRIFDENSKELELSPENWQKRIMRGKKLYQSIDVGEVNCSTFICPKSACGGSVVSDANKRKWSVFTSKKWHFAHLSPSSM
jgi:hypothetical protein